MEKPSGRLRISHFFHGYLRSCQSKNVSSIAQEPVFIRRELHFLKPSSTSLIFPSICRPKTSEFIAIDDVFDRRTTPKRSTHFGSSSDTDGRRCPHPSPSSPSNSFIKFQEIRYKERCDGRKKKIRDIMASSNSSATHSHGFFTSEDDDERAKEKETLFSSSNSSCGSSEFYHHPKKNNRKARCRKAQRRKPDVGFVDFASIPKTVKGKVEKSVAVVKCSSDPYCDFMSSMVEMIVEKQMYTAEDLEQLLHCFLLLNSPHHHQVIVEVFSEILEALFPNCN